MSSHTLSVLVEDKPGVLARIAGLFSRRGFNIESLAVGPTEHPEISRMTIVVNVEGSPLEQVTKQLNKLVEVIKIVELDQDASVHRELVLVKVAASAETRGQVLDVVQLFRASVIDVATDAITVQVIGNAAKIADVLKILEPFGIRELVQSGMVAIGRGSRSISERSLRPVAASPVESMMAPAEVNVTLLCRLTMLPTAIVPTVCCTKILPCAIALISPPSTLATMNRSPSPTCPLFCELMMTLWPEIVPPPLLTLPFTTVIAAVSPACTSPTIDTSVLTVVPSPTWTMTSCAAEMSPSFTRPLTLTSSVTCVTFPVRYLWESLRRGYEGNRFEADAQRYAACAKPRSGSRRNCTRSSASSCAS